MHTIITTIPGTVMPPPLGGLLLAWSHGAEPHSHYGWTSEESDAEEETKGEDGEEETTGEVGETNGAFWTGDELFDRISQEVLNSPEPEVEKKTYVSKAEALEMVTRKQNKLSPVQAARELLMQVTGNSLEAMGRKDGNRMLLEVDCLARKIRQVLYDHKAKKFLKKRELLEDNLASFSQNSFVAKIREQAEDESEEETSLEVEDEEVTEETKEKVYRKALNKLKDKDTMKRRTDAILAAVRLEAAKQDVTTTELLAYLLYRESYNQDKKLAEAMLRQFKGGEMKENKVSDMKTLAMVLRGRFGRTTYFNVRRTLRPYKGFGQQSFHQTYFVFIHFFQLNSS
jgi:hypothetical protein